MNLQHLNWDSEFFGFNIAKLNEISNESDFLEGLETMKSQTIRLAYISVSPENQLLNELIKTNGGFLADEKVTYTQHINSLPTTILPAITSYSETIASPQLIRLAVQSGEFSRFRVDTNFSADSYERLYTQWITNSVRKVFDNEVFVYLENEQILGMVTLKDKSDSGSISLIAVDSTQRGKNIGTALVQATFYAYAQRNIFDIDVVTQKANHLACRFYEKNGFTVQSVENIYHLWL